MTAPSILRLAALTGLAVLLAGCLGSPEPYHPGYQERPAQIKEEDAEARARRLAIPLEIARNDAFIQVGRKEIARVMGEVPSNVFRSYEVDLDDALPRGQAERILRRPPYYLSRLQKEAVALAEEDAKVEAGAEEGKEEGDEWGDEGGDKDGGDEWGDEGGSDEDEDW